jgi:general nucleoside transport system ATP-binding protein
MTAPPVLSLRGIRKHFGSVHALRGADFTLMPGELHALLGENGAGKTTLMRVAYGLVRPEAGEIAIDGVVRQIASPRVAQRLRIGMVHQHPTSIPALSVAENVALAAGWTGRPAALRARVQALAEGIGLPLEPDAPAGRLSMALKQRLEIVKALAADARILLLDEPTAVLAPGEADELLRVIGDFTARGGAAVLITHKLDEALTAATRLTVLRRGEVVLEGPVVGQSAATVARAMVGEGSDAPDPGDDAAAPPAIWPGSALVRLEDLEVPRESGYGIAVRHATLSIRPGEIVGIAAVEGNGQRELLRAVAGRLPPLRGRRDVAGPIGFVPEDRTTEGLIPELTLTDNVVLGSQRDDPWLRSGRLDWKVARARTAALLSEYDIVAGGPEALAAELSGGNQQKLVLARELARAPRVIVAENPTRGLDLKASESIHARLRAAAAAGAAVLIYSSDLDEVLALAHRVLVAARGALLDVPEGSGRTEVGQLMVTGGR